MNSIYILMNKHTPLAKINMSNNGRIHDILKIYDINAFPVGIISSNTASQNLKKNEILDNLSSWWENRSIPASRDGLMQILQEHDIEQTSVLTKKCLGLSLSDQYWIKPDNSDISWEDINFFDHSFSSDIGELFFNPHFAMDNIDFMSPDNTSDGWLKKKWLIINQKRCLIKTGSNPFNQEPFNEVIATLIMQKLGITPYTVYKLYKDDAQGTCSVCENFITEDTELVSAYSLYKAFPHLKPPVTSRNQMYEWYMNIGKELHIPHFSDDIDNMIILDYILANSDRHTGNFGVIRNINNLKYISTAPIYDSGTSLWYNYTERSCKIGEAVTAQPFAKSHEEQIKLVRNWRRFDFSKLQNIGDEIYRILQKNPLSSAARNKLICQAVAERVSMLKLYQKCCRNLHSVKPSHDEIIATLKILKLNLQPIYYYYRDLYVPSSKRKYNPQFDKIILQNLLHDGFDLTSSKKILLNSPNIKSEKMVDILFREITNN